MPESLCARWHLHCHCPRVRFAYYACLAATLAVLDFLSKRWVEASLSPGDSVAWSSFFNLTLTFNRGAAFSFLADAPGWQHGFLVGLAVTASLVMLVLLWRHALQTRFALALACILGGAVGNLIDRLMLGHVVDFLDFHLAGYHWPAFNLADSAIFVGALLLVWDSLRPQARPA